MCARAAAKLGDEIVATDTHLVLPAPLAKPEPIYPPLPFKGIITKSLSKDVFIEGNPAATVGSGAANTTPHPPVPPPATYFRPPSNQGIILTGSTGVFINGKPAARVGDTAITCNDPVDLPVGKVVAAGKVFIGETGAGALVPPFPEPPPEPKLLTAKWGQPGSIVSAGWEKSKVKIGEEAKLIVNVKDFEDGTPAKFLIWERKGSQDTIMKEIEEEIRGNKAEAMWKHSVEKCEEKLKEDVGEEEKEEEEPKYYFFVDVEGEERRSEALKFTYPLDIYLEDEDDEPLDGVEYKITFSDGTTKEGVFKNGHARIEDAPYGKFTIEVEEHDLVFS